MLLYTLMAQKPRLEPNWIGKENQPKLELDERDAGGLLGDAGDKGE